MQQRGTLDGFYVLGACQLHDDGQLMVYLIKDGFDAFGAAEVQSVDQGSS